MKAKTDGFTLIEVLVVIAVIGILSSVMLVRLGQAREKAQDAALKHTLTNIRRDAAIYYDDNDRVYGSSSVGPSESACDQVDTIFTHESIKRAIDDVEERSGEEATCVIGNEQTTYAVSIPLISEAGRSFCVDSYTTAEEYGVAVSAEITAAGVADCKE